MIWASKQQCWVVRPTEHTKLMDVVEWCHKIFGKHKILDHQCGVWSYAPGDFYGVYSKQGQYLVPCRDTIFAFDDRDDILIFVLAWGDSNNYYESLYE